MVMNGLVLLIAFLLASSFGTIVVVGVIAWGRFALAFFLLPGFAVFLRGAAAVVGGGDLFAMFALLLSGAFGSVFLRWRRGCRCVRHR